MVFHALYSLFRRFVDAILQMLGVSSSSPRIGGSPNTLHVHVKYAGRTVQVDLDPSWSVSRVKDEIAPLLKVNPNEIKIIFAGNELPDSFLLETCDVGQQSYLHAVRVQIQNSAATALSGGDNLMRADVSNNAGAAEVPMPHLRTRTFSSNNEEDAEGGGGAISSEYNNHLGTEDENPTTTTSVAPAADKQSDFFVFCPECNDLKEGKLRVRCAVCLSGAFMVHRPPEGWDDVLVPSRILGICDGDGGCDGRRTDTTYAQFYFKCTQHVTKGEDDSASPLSLIRRNREQVPCLACGDVKEVVFIFPCQLAHVTCTDCFKDYALANLNQRGFIQDRDVGYTLGCPALCTNSLINDPHHFKILGKYQYDRYQRFGTEECLLQMGGVFCPQPDCGMGIIPQDSNCDKIACLHGCEYVFCRKCLEGWHLGPCRSEGQSLPSAEDCSSGGYRAAGYFVSEDRAAAAQWGDPTRRAMRLSTKPCPNCRVPTERAGGCMHMDCTKCKFEWCWVCQTKWTRECMGNHWFG